MSRFYRHVIRPLLFAQSPEAIHELTIASLGWASRSSVLCDAVGSFCGADSLPIQVFGLDFPNPIGLGAGMDKAAEAVPAWAALGFGFSELGAATWRPQPGNPPPRVFRVVSEEAIVNRMGFNNPGAESVAATLAAWRASGRWPRHPVGMNLGKSKVTPLEAAAEDYAQSLRVLWPHLDFFVVNVSSPNTPNLRQLQDRAALDEILAALQETNRGAAAAADDALRSGGDSAPALRGPRRTKPILVKVAPDLSDGALDEIVGLVESRQIAGLVATNTTVERPASTDPDVNRLYAEPGGLSGRPLRRRSTEVVRRLYRQSGGRVPIIGVGGVFDAADAWEKITAGASLVQVYTGLVYEGPTVVRRIVRGLRERLAVAGYSDLAQAVGTDSTRPHTGSSETGAP
jgi:dihydroorotate dehydrogenase